MIPRRLQNRLLVEQVTMRKMFPYFKLYQTNDDEICFKGWYTTTANQGYTLKLLISEHYPEKQPKLFVIYPKILQQHGSIVPINDLEYSHKFHTLNKNPEGHLQICHFSTESWQAGCTCVGVMAKAQLWCEAHVEHLATGLSINTILTNWKRSKEKWNLNELNWKELLEICHQDNNLMTDYSLIKNQNLLGQALFPDILMEKSKSLLKTLPFPDCFEL